MYQDKAQMVWLEVEAGQVDGAAVVVAVTQPQGKGQVVEVSVMMEVEDHSANRVMLTPTARLVPQLAKSMAIHFFCLCLEGQVVVVRRLATVAKQQREGVFKTALAKAKSSGRQVTEQDIDKAAQPEICVGAAPSCACR